MANELQIQLAVLQSTITNLTASLEMLNKTLATHIEKDAETKTRIALIEQNTEKINSHIEDHCGSLHGTDGLTTRVKILETQANNRQQITDRKIVVIIGIATILGGIFGSVLAVLVQNWTNK